MTVYAVNLPYADSRSLVAPACRPDDGVIHLLLIRKGATKAGLLQALGSMETGGHLQVDNVDLIRVRAARLEPAEKATTGYDNEEGPTNKYCGKMVVDGELVECGPVHFSVLPSAARIAAKRGGE